MTGPHADGGVEGKFFDVRQRATIEAAMARIIPTDDQPGAREAGTIEFLDRYLSGLDFIYAKPDGSGFEKLEGKRADAWKQRIEMLRARYLEGINEMDSRSRSQFGGEFVWLTTEQQDCILGGLEHPAIQIETAMEGANGRRALRCRRPARDASPKKVEGVQFLDLQIRRINCLLAHKENVLP